MTRETKIGLLVGLAFIVVFAMLLSHSGPTAPPGDLRQIARAQQPPAPAVLNQPTNEPDLPISIHRDAPDVPGMTDRVPQEAVELDPPAPSEPTAPDDLPSPGILNPTQPPGTQPPPLGVAEAHERGRLESIRTAPTDLITAEPTVRELEPSQTPEPLVKDSPPPSDPQEPSNAPIEPRRAVATIPPATREHIVQKGEVVISILKNEYGTSSQKLIDAFRAANKDIKDIHKVVEGQKVIIPALPPDMFEPADGSVVLDAAARSKQAELAKIEKLINEPRKAPPAAKAPDAIASVDSGRQKDAPAAAQGRRSSEPRVYEIQSKDTFSSIAREHLGSETLWKEIQRLNPKVDPARMRPGTRIKLPIRRSISSAGTAGST